MVLYLIRHGRTDAYSNNRRQSPDTPLGEYGLNQAKLLAEKLKLVKIDHLYSSSWPRALQTANEISLIKNISVNIHSHLHENDKHPALNNAILGSDINQRYLKEREENKYNLNWKFDGEGESVNDLLQRAHNVIEELKTNHSKESVAIVSHAIFLGALIGLILLGPDIDHKSFAQFVQSLRIENASLTTLKYDPEKKTWKLLSLNDHSHLQKDWLESHRD
jgi:broad specificity phosphatase PhoE